jgi:hypothetical protein
VGLLYSRVIVQRKGEEASRFRKCTGESGESELIVFKVTMLVKSQTSSCSKVHVLNLKTATENLTQVSPFPVSVP